MIHPEHFFVVADFRPRHSPNHLMRPRQSNGITAVLMKQLCHRILQKQSGLKDPQFTPAVRVSGGEIHFFFKIVLLSSIGLLSHRKESTTKTVASSLPFRYNLCWFSRDTPLFPYWEPPSSVPSHPVQKKDNDFHPDFPGNQ